MKIEALSGWTREQKHVVAASFLGWPLDAFDFFLLVFGRADVASFLKRKWSEELEYRLIKELWAFHNDRIAVRYAYEWHDDSGNWFRSYGNENWEFGQDGLMRRRYSSINDLPIAESERKFHWPLGRRPDRHPSLTELGL